MQLRLLTIRDNASRLSTVINTTSKKKVSYDKSRIVKKYSGNFKFKKDGIYTVVAIDRAGNKITKKVKVTNIDKKAPSKPTINKVTSKSTRGSGKAEKKSIIYLYEGKKLLTK